MFDFTKEQDTSTSIYKYINIEISLSTYTRSAVFCSVNCTVACQLKFSSNVTLEKSWRNTVCPLMHQDFEIMQTF